MVNSYSVLYLSNSALENNALPLVEHIIYKITIVLEVKVTSLSM